VDVVVNAAGGEPDVVRSPRVWWFDHDGHESWPDVLSGCDETVRGCHGTPCCLLEHADASVKLAVLRRASFAVHPLFASENRVQLLWKSIPLLMAKLRELHSSGGVEAESKPSVRSAPSASGRPPSALALLRHGFRSVGFVLRRLLWSEQWFLLVDHGEEVAAERSEDRSRPEKLGERLRRARPLLPPRDRFWADPHWLPSNDDGLLLVEEYVYAQRRGRIALLRLNGSGGVEESRTVLARDYHLSYPFVLQLGDDVYMIPESIEAARIDAFRCVEYPWRWEHAGTLLDGVRAVDATVFPHVGRWWMFATVLERAWLTPRDTLHVFVADNPLKGPWRPHPANPVVYDVRGARPAGPVFSAGDRLFRPSQDCSRGYGHGIRLKEIVALDESRYEERDVAFFSSIWRGTAGTHTLSLARQALVVDAMRRIPVDWRTPSSTPR
jgi:hypothetical protein